MIVTIGEMIRKYVKVSNTEIIGQLASLLHRPFSLAIRMFSNKTNNPEMAE